MTADAPTGEVATGEVAVNVLVVGGGPAGLMAAEVAARLGASVLVADHRRGPGRKLLLAGRSGLNVAHSEPTADVLARFEGSAAAVVRRAVTGFDADSVRAWMTGLGMATFVGSSGRVFPVGMRAAPLLRSWLARLELLGVRVRTGAALRVVEPGRVVLGTADGELVVRFGAAVLALGGASWPSVGSDGSWTALLASAGVAIEPWAPANVGALVAWSELLTSRHDGAALKNVALTAGGSRVRGELVITSRGLEGGPVYALSSELRNGPSVVTIDMRADLLPGALEARIRRRAPRSSLSTTLRRNAGLSAAAVALVQESIARGWARRPSIPEDIASLVRAVPVAVTGTAGLDRAISSAGGVRGDAVDADGQLLAIPGVWCAGEMLDWEAPTGGYLIHGSLATGRTAGLAAARRARSDDHGTPVAGP